MKNIPKTCKKIGKLDFKNGAECSYISCKNGWGLKLYASENVRNFGYNIQLKLSHKNLAPKLGRKFEIEISGNRARGLHCYYNDLNKAKLYGYITKEANVKPVSYKAILGLKKRLKNRFNYDFVDDGFRNVGYIGKNLVLIDCNPLSFDNYSDSWYISNLDIS